MFSSNAIAPLIVFMATVLALSLQALTASGHFPREHRASTLVSTAGALILFGSIAVAIVSLAIAMLAAWRLIPWYAAVIGGGLAILSAPLILQRFSDRFVDGRNALLVFAGADAACALLLAWLVAQP